MLEIFRGDERPYWTPTVTVSGVNDDMTTGYTFVVKVHEADDTTTVLLTKTTGIIGGAGGLVTVNWVPTETELPPDLYVAQLTAKRTVDSAEWTVSEPLRIKARA